MGATWKSVNHENLACAYKWDFDFGYEQVAKADCEYPFYIGDIEHLKKRPFILKKLPFVKALFLQ